ncbi:ferric reductase like protein [Tumebacillus sp. BK434]|uniref:ferric reductase-like transmembrane domain-containing protein n=1 Tax=Tumebacillus sp. BK434 TaxID=2512169 RepID=UPI00105164C2|nr:ferric reductase-like transmembrane domain-containing protein [Tumebacillus sp. BK434]TCP52185.1 ferric reductase like protein [Tumebacillus sp. BK434]
MILFNAWLLIRASGIVAYVLLSLTVLTGLYSMFRKHRSLPPGLVPALHNTLSNWALYLVLFHAAMLFYDHYKSYSWQDILIPFHAADAARIPMGIGILGLYLLAFTILTTELRRTIGSRIWRLLHMLSPVAYLLATVHGIWQGTDTQAAWMVGMYWVSWSLTLFMVGLRMLPKKEIPAAE